MTKQNFFLDNETVSNPFQIHIRESHYKKKICISEILLKSQNKNLKNEITYAELLFCYQSVIDTIKNLLEGKFSHFDALTSTTCCHGIAIFVNNLILEAKGFHLEDLLSIGQKKKNELQHKIHNENSLFTDSWNLPESLIELSRMHVLFLIRENDSDRVVKMNVTNLKKNDRLTLSFFSKLVTRLQVYYSNKVAESYYDYFSKMDNAVSVSDVPVAEWARYVHPEYLRIDRRGRKYAACLFSMQVSLAHLIHKNGKIALINDIRSSNGEIVERYVQIFQGDGISKLIPLGSREDQIALMDQLEPLVVFGGCSFSEDVDSVRDNLNKWHDRFPQFVLAADIHYPQFPKVRDDPDFNSIKIDPKEKILESAFSQYSQVEGIRAKDPSLFYLTHIYPASLKQIVATIRREPDELPHLFIPKVALEN